MAQVQAKYSLDQTQAQRNVDACAAATRSPSAIARAIIDQKASAVTERITRKTVNFLHPFALAGVEGEQPAGAYTVETTEEPIGGLSFIAYRRVSTTIVLVSRQFGPASRQVVTIDPLDLEAAQKGDGAKRATATSCKAVEQ